MKLSRSQQSTALSYVNNGDEKYLKIITDLQAQNTCIKKALSKAQQLIHMYERQNRQLKKQICQKQNSKIQQLVHVGVGTSNDNTQEHCYLSSSDLMKKINQLLQSQAKSQNKIQQLCEKIHILEKQQNRTKIKKQHFDINLALKNLSQVSQIQQIDPMTSSMVSYKKVHNYLQLQALHNKIIRKDSLSKDQKNGKSIVETVFSSKTNKSRCESQKNFNRNISVQSKSHKRGVSQAKKSRSQSRSRVQLSASDRKIYK